MSSFSKKISIQIILAGIFIIGAFWALDYSQKGIWFYFVIIMLTVFIFSFGYVLGQRIKVPIEKILKRAERLSNGDFSETIRIETKDELSDLANVLNKITEDLKKAQENQKNIDSSIDMKVRAKTYELEETIKALEQKVKNRTAELERLVKGKNLKITPPQKPTDKDNNN